MVLHTCIFCKNIDSVNSTLTKNFHLENSKLLLNQYHNYSTIQYIIEEFVFCIKVKSTSVHFFKHNECFVLHLGVNSIAQSGFCFLDVLNEHSMHYIQFSVSLTINNYVKKSFTTLKNITTGRNFIP